jgi:CSLREA domain-containing protein
MTAVCALPGGAQAATITVNTTADGVENGGDCSLREAVLSANTNSSALGCAGDTAGADTIVLRAGQTYTLTMHGIDDLWNSASMKGDLDINSQVTIRSDGAPLATIDGDSQPTLDFTDRDRVLQVLPAAGGVTLERIRVQDGFERSGQGGGGIRSDSQLNVIDSEVVDNAVALSSPADSTWGGGLYAETGSLTVTGSTIAGNRVDDSGNESADGGGVMAYSATLVMTNTTVSGNSTTEDVGATNFDAHGGGIYTFQGATTLTNVTVTANTATGRGGAGDGAGIFVFSGPLTIRGAIVAGNTATGGGDCSGTVGSMGSNVVGTCTLTGGTNDLTGAAANLGVLANYGGQTRTHTLNPGSPAINRGGTCPATDQRGFFRAPVAPCDAGAVELNAPATLPQPPPAGSTGQRAAALKKCKKKKSKKARKKCRAKAALLPI